MTSFFDRQVNCMTQPERGLVWSMLTIVLDPLAPGMPVEAWNAAWSTATFNAAERQEWFRTGFGLVNVFIDRLS